VSINIDTKPTKTKTKNRLKTPRVIHYESYVYWTVHHLDS